VRDFIPEQIIDFGTIKLIEATNSFFACLIECHFPVHLIQVVIVDDNEARADSKLLCSDALIICKAFVEGISPLICLRDWPKDGKVFNLKGFTLALNLVAQAFCNATPDHVEQTKGFSLGHIKCVSRAGVFGYVVVTRLNSCWVFDKR